MVAINLSRTVVDSRVAKLVRLGLLLLLLGAVWEQSQAAELPEHPQKIVDFQFVAAHSVYAGSLIFDQLLTSQGTSHGCAEANPDLGIHPSARQLAIHGLIEFGLVTAGDAGLKALGKHLDAPRWLSRTFGSLGAAIGTGKHIRGGYAWTQTNCL